MSAIMSRIQQLMESEEFKLHVEDNSEILETAQDALFEFVKGLKPYIHEHLDEFIVVGDLKATETNMIEFVESGVETFIRELVSMMNNEEPETTPNV
jgi:hypothetical protein